MASFVTSIHEVGVKAICVLEANKVATSVTALRPLQRLLTPGTRLAAAMEILSGCKSGEQLNNIVNTVAKKWWVEAHWRSDNPELPADKANDMRARDNWGNSAPISQLSVNVGRWKYAVDDPFPPWTSLMKAKLYTDPKNQWLLDLLKKPVLHPQIGETGSPDITLFTVGEHCLRLFKHAPEMPVGIRTVPVRLVLAQASFVQRLTPLAKQALLNGALACVWGHRGAVDNYITGIDDLGVHLRKTFVNYYIKGATEEGHSQDTTAASLSLCLIGDSAHFTTKVCTIYPYPH